MSVNFENREIQLKVQREILLSEDDLVLSIEAALDNCSYGRAGSKKSELEESQFRNLVRVAESTESSRVIQNFLRYQVGRDEKWGRGSGSLAEKIIENIDGLLRLKAEAIAQRAETSEINQIWIQLIRLYLGYGSRYLKYLKTEPFPQKTKSSNGQFTSKKGILKPTKNSSGSIADELIQERREEAKRE